MPRVLFDVKWSRRASEEQTPKKNEKGTLKMGMVECLVFWFNMS